jgi:hypothetical protein
MPSDPDRDEHGMIVPHDHAEIDDDCYVIRHIIPPNDLHLGRVSSGAFSESTVAGIRCGMSVDIECWMIKDGLEPLYYVRDPAHGATRLRVGYLRALGMKVGWDPDNGHKHHGAVWGGTQTNRKKMQKSAETLRKAAGQQ